MPTTRPRPADLPMLPVPVDGATTSAGLLLEASAALVRALDADLRREADTPLGTYEVLVRLGRAPGRRLRQVEMARQLTLTTGGITRLVDRLEAAGLVQRVADPTDRRGSYARLTDEGAALRDQATATYVASLQRHLVEPVGAEALAALDEPLRRLREALAR